MLLPYEGLYSRCPPHCSEDAGVLFQRSPGGLTLGLRARSCEQIVAVWRDLTGAGMGSAAMPVTRNEVPLRGVQSGLFERTKSGAGIERPALLRGRGKPQRGSGHEGRSS